MANKLTDLIAKIRTEKSAKIMRKHIADSFEDLNSRFFSYEESYKGSVIDSGNSNKEIVDARIDGVNQVSYEILRERLDDMAAKIKNLNNIKNETVDYIYPVGSVILTMDNENPSERFNGVWIQVAQGRTLVGVGTEQDKNGTLKTFALGNNEGEYSHKMTQYESPYAKSGDEAKGYVLTLGTGGFCDRVAVTRSESAQKFMSLSGPSFAVYIWQRIS